MLLRIAVALLVAASPVLARSQVWIVSDSACPGSDFSILQDAIDAAADGDTIVFRPSNSILSSAIDINQKSLTIINGDPNFILAPFIFSNNITVQGLLPNQSVAIIGFTPSGTNEVLRIENNQGSVWIDGGQSSSMTTFVKAASIIVENSSSVTILRMRVRAGDCIQNCPTATPGFGIAGAPGIEVINSEVELYDCFLIGGRGSEGYDPLFPSGKAGSGGAGALLDNSTVNAYGTTFLGGSGGTNSQNLPAPFCADGGDGGSGIFMKDTASTIRLQNSTASAGLGGKWSIGTPVPLGCSDGVPGVQVDGPGIGQITQLAGSNRSLELSDTRAILEGEPFTITSTGEQGDILFLGVGVDHDPIFQAPFFGTAAFAPLDFFRIGKIGASGSKSLTVAAGDIVNPGESAPSICRPITSTSASICSSAARRRRRSSIPRTTIWTVACL